MQLLFDIGNTRSKATACSPTKGLSDSLWVANDLDKLLLQINVTANEIWVSNVCRQKDNARITQILQDRFAVQAQFAELQQPCMGVNSNYQNRLGIDRLLAMVAAWHHLYAACIVVDCGTAVTVDLLDHEGVHQGGVIMPGLHTLQANLCDRIQAPSAQKPGKYVLFPLNTADALHTGCCLAWQSSIEKTCHLMQEQIPDATVIITGGDSERCVQSLNKKIKSIQWVPNLVLQGLHLYANGNHA